jgi:hypothetical protein
VAAVAAITALTKSRPCIVNHAPGVDFLFEMRKQVRIQQLKLIRFQIRIQIQTQRPTCPDS